MSDTLSCTLLETNRRLYACIDETLVGIFLSVLFGTLNSVTLIFEIREHQGLILKHIISTSTKNLQVLQLTELLLVYVGIFPSLR